MIDAAGFSRRRNPLESLHELRPEEESAMQDDYWGDAAIIM
jgi:hypothetical protein